MLKIDDNSFVKIVFTKGLKSPNYYSASFESSNITELFEDLLDIFTKGCVILFSQDNKTVNLTKLTSQDFELINKHFNSFGMNIHYKINHISQVTKLDNHEYYYKPVPDEDIEKIFHDSLVGSDLINYKECISNKLEDRRYQLRSDDLMYIVWFSNLI